MPATREPPSPVISIRFYLDQPGGDGLPFFEVNAVYLVSATSAPETAPACWARPAGRLARQ